MNTALALITLGFSAILSVYLYAIFTRQARRIKTLQMKIDALTEGWVK